MVCFLDSRRAIWSAIVVVGSLCILSGCMHAHRGSGVESTVSGPSLQPYDGVNVPNAPALHEPLPELSPVPPLPGAGHSLPPEPLPPPAPPEPSESNSAQAELSREPVLQTRSFWSQMTSRASIGRSAPVSQLPAIRQGHHAAVASISVPNRTMDPRFAATPFGVANSVAGTNPRASKFDETTARNFPLLSSLAGENNSRQIESVSSPAWRGSVLSVPRSAQVAGEANGPIITPIQQPLTTRNEVIEDWPYRSRPSALANDSRKNVSPQQASEAQPIPLSETQFGSATEPAPTAAPETGPSLLPPGP